MALDTEELDLSAIMASYHGDKGRPPYHAAMMVALLLYAYTVGICSSPRIAKVCMERLDSMAIAAIRLTSVPSRSSVVGMLRRWRRRSYRCSSRANRLSW